MKSVQLIQDLYKLEEKYATGELYKEICLFKLYLELKIQNEGCPE